jgi:hypothetical protein
MGYLEQWNIGAADSAFRKKVEHAICKSAIAIASEGGRHDEG